MSRSFLTANPSNDLSERLSLVNAGLFATTKSPRVLPPTQILKIPGSKTTNLPGKIQLIVAQLYSLITWIEYGFKQVKDELGWADFRLTDYTSIERWWEMIFSAYLLVSLKPSYFQSEAPNPHSIAEEPSVLNSSSVAQFSQHPWWELGTAWKSALNNLRLIIQPYVFYCLISPWLQVFKIPGFQRGFLKLINFMNHFRASPATLAIAV
jgi:hypothetical protein